MAVAERPSIVEVENNLPQQLLFNKCERKKKKTSLKTRSRAQCNNKSF